MKEKNVFGEFLLKNRILCLIGLLFFTLFGASGGQFLYFDNDYRAFFGKENPQLNAFEKLQQTYTQVDNVKPGQPVPGGVYYNIFVPRLHLKEFMAQVMNQEQANLYESRTRVRRNPPGKNRVFIWVKDI